MNYISGGNVINPNIGAKKARFNGGAISQDTNNKIYHLLNSDFPSWFIEIGKNNELFNIINNAFSLQMNLLGFTPDEKTNIINPYILNNIGNFFSFFKKGEGLFPDHNTYGYVESKISTNHQKIEYFLAEYLNSEKHRICLYPYRFENQESFISTINHEIHHFLFRIFYILRNSEKKNIQEIINIFQSNSFKLVDEILAHMDGGGQSLFHYGNNGNELLHQKAGKGKIKMGDLYGKAGDISHKLTILNIYIYNLLGQNFGLDPNKIKNQQLFGEGNKIFHKYNENLRFFLIQGIEKPELLVLMSKLLDNSKYIEFYNEIIKLN